MVDEEPVTNEEPITTDEPTVDEETTDSIISVDDLKERLRLAGIDFGNYSDEDLEKLIQLTLQDIEARTGASIINPKLITEYDSHFRGEFYETDYYPIICSETTLDTEVIEPRRVDLERGILYFKPFTEGELEVKYKIQYTDTVFLAQLLTNMIILTIDSDVVHGTWNSIKEEGVSVTYGSGSGGLQGKVDDMLATLSGYYRPRVRLL